MVEKYGVVFFWDDEYKGYVAEAVGLPGCFSQGKTMEEAICVKSGGFFWGNVI